MTNSNPPAAQETFTVDQLARDHKALHLAGVVRSLEHVIGPTDSVRIYAPEAKAILAALSPQEQARPVAEAGEQRRLVHLDAAEAVIEVLQQSIPAMDGYDEEEIAALETELASAILAALQPNPASEVK